MPIFFGSNEEEYNAWIYYFVHPTDAGSSGWQCDIRKVAHADARSWIHVAGTILFGSGVACPDSSYQSKFWDYTRGRYAEEAYNVECFTEVQHIPALESLVTLAADFDAWGTLTVTISNRSHVQIRQDDMCARDQPHEGAEVALHMALVL